MVEAIIWWLTLQLLGIAALPLAAVLLRALPDRGYSMAKILGILLTVWLAYVLAMTGLVPFGQLLLVGCALVMAALSGWLLMRNGRAMLHEMRAFLRRGTTLRYILIAEVLFALAFVLYALLRAYDPDIFGTEQFMDFGFMNAIAKSTTFPPNDPWLAGNPINYYYFGYVMMAALSVLSGVPTQVGFNLANVTLFALTALGAFGLAFNIVTLARQPRTVAETADEIAEKRWVRHYAVRRVRYKEPEPVPAKPTVPALPTRAVRRVPTESGAHATAVATAEAKTAEKTLDGPVPSTRIVAVDGRRGGRSGRNGRSRERVPGRGRERRQAAPPAYAPFDAPPRIGRSWAPYWVGLLAALMVVAMGNLTVMFAKHDGDPSSGNGWRFCLACLDTSYDWFAPSRIIQDYMTVQTEQGPVKQEFGVQTINEFPAFSFLLADMHPHVMALPLVLLALGCALALSRRKIVRASSPLDGLPGGLRAWIAFILLSIVAGSLYPANTWDYPTYLLLMFGGMALPYLSAMRREVAPVGWSWLMPWFVQVLLLVVLSLLAFVQFHLTFRTPVGGQGLLALNPADKTIVGFLVVFGIFLVAIVGWLIYELVGYWREAGIRAAEEGRRTREPLIIGGVVLVLVALAVVLRFPLLGLLGPMAVVQLYLVLREPEKTVRNFVLLMSAVATLIALAVEIVYLRDVFNDRQNTLFKFYYQMWVIWSVVTAYGAWRVVRGVWGRPDADVAEDTEAEVLPSPPVLRGGRDLLTVWARVIVALWAGVFGLLVLSGLAYSVFGPMSKVGQNPTLWGLDGTTHLSRSAGGDYEAINWLKANATGSDVVLECCRDEYNNPGHAGRVSSYSGVPTLISWDGHEAQWRGGQPELLSDLGRRRTFVNSIYKGVDPDSGQPLTAESMLTLLQQNGVNYVFVGAAERGVPGVTGNFPEERITAEAEALMGEALPVAFQSGETVIYRVEGTVSGEGPPQPDQPTATATPDLTAPPAGLFDTGPASGIRGRFNLPRDIVRDAEGNFYVSDTQNFRIQKFDADGTFVMMFGSRGTEDGQFAAIDEQSVGAGPGGIAVDGAGNIYVADTWNHRVQKFDASGKFVAKWGSFVNLSDPASASEPNKESRFFGPRGIAVGPNGDIYVTDTGNKRVLIFDANGAPKGQVGVGTSPEKPGGEYPHNLEGELNEPIGVAVDKDGNVYVADVNNKRIQKFDAAGEPVAQWPVPANNWEPSPYLEPFLGVDDAGNVYATAPSGRGVLKFSPSGEVAGESKGVEERPYNLPTGIHVDGDGTIYVVDTGAHTVVRVGKIE